MGLCLPSKVKCHKAHFSLLTFVSASLSKEKLSPQTSYALKRSSLFNSSSKERMFSRLSSFWNVFFLELMFCWKLCLYGKDVIRGSWLWPRVGLEFLEDCLQFWIRITVISLDANFLELPDNLSDKSLSLYIYFSSIFQFHIIWNPLVWGFNLNTMIWKKGI